MSFLDRFKPQPRWKHADAAVRAAAVDEIPADEESLATLRELASGDEDVRVRRAAAGRLHRAADILPLARDERDEDLRRELVERLVSIATAADEAGRRRGAARSKGLRISGSSRRWRRLAARQRFAAAALGRVHDVKALSSVARKAAHPGTALDAAQRIADRAELLNVAVKTDHKDAGVAALERAVESNEAGELRETLDLVAARAKNKSVSKRARAMMQALDEARSRTAGRTRSMAAAGGGPGGPRRIDFAGRRERRAGTGAHRGRVGGAGDRTGVRARTGQRGAIRSGRGPGAQRHRGAPAHGSGAPRRRRSARRAAREPGRDDPAGREHSRRGRARTDRTGDPRMGSARRRGRRCRDGRARDAVRVGRCRRAAAPPEPARHAADARPPRGARERGGAPER